MIRRWDLWRLERQTSCVWGGGDINYFVIKMARKSWLVLPSPWSVGCECWWVRWCGIGSFSDYFIIRFSLSNIQVFITLGSLIYFGNIIHSIVPRESFLPPLLSRFVFGFAPANDLCGFEMHISSYHAYYTPKNCTKGVVLVVVKVLTKFLWWYIRRHVGRIITRLFFWEARLPCRICVVYTIMM